MIIVITCQRDLLTVTLSPLCSETPVRAVERRSPDHSASRYSFGDRLAQGSIHAYGLRLILRDYLFFVFLSYPAPRIMLALVLLLVSQNAL